MQNPVGVEVVDPIKYLVEERLDHGVGYDRLWLLSHFDGSVVFDDVLKKRSRHVQL